MRSGQGSSSCKVVAIDAQWSGLNARVSIAGSLANCVLTQLNRDAMLKVLPSRHEDLIDWTWEQFQPLVDDLLTVPVTADTIENWLGGWTQLITLRDEIESRAFVATSVDTTDQAAQERFEYFNNHIQPEFTRAQHLLNQKLVDSGLVPAGMEIAIRRMQNGIELFREDNLPLLSDEQNLANEYSRIIGAQTVEWEGEQRTLRQMAPLLHDADRNRRERSLRLTVDRMLQDRDGLNALWIRLLDLRRDIAANADLPDYRAYKWKEWNRFDYTPADALTFFDAIEAEVVPAYQRVLERRRDALGLDTLRPWDTEVDVAGREALRPFSDVTTLQDKTISIFQAVDPELGGLHADHARRGLLRPGQPRQQGTGRLLYLFSTDAPSLHFHERRRPSR